MVACKDFQKENTGIVVDFSDKVDLARSIDKIEELLERKEELRGKIRQIAIKYRSYDLAKKIYKEIYS